MPSRILGVLQLRQLDMRQVQPMRMAFGIRIEAKLRHQSSMDVVAYSANPFRLGIEIPCFSQGYQPGIQRLYIG